MYTRGPFHCTLREDREVVPRNVELCDNLTAPYWEAVHDAGKGCP